MTRAFPARLLGAFSAPLLFLLFASPLLGFAHQQSDDSAALHEAVVDGESARVLHLLERGADPDVRGPDGTPVLLTAALNGRADIVASLLSSGAEANVQDADGYTPLMAAAERGASLAAVIALLDAGADVNASVEGWTPLWGALDHGDPEIIEVVLAHGADVNAALPASMELEELCRPGQWACRSTSLLMLASLGGETELVKTLLKYGPDLAAQDAAGRNALSYAEDGEHPAIVEILRNAGVPESEDVSGNPTAQPSYTLQDLGALGVRLTSVAQRMEEVPSAHGDSEADNRREWEISVNLVTLVEGLDSRLEDLATAQYLAGLASDENAETAWTIYHGWTRSLFDDIAGTAEWFCEGWALEAETAMVKEGVTEYCSIGREVRQLLAPALQAMD